MVTPDGNAPRLVVTGPAEVTGLVLPLTAPELVVGHSDTADLVLEDRFVSRRHALITVDPSGAVTIWDLNSTGGTFVNDERLTGPRVLESGDVVRFADLAARFEPGAAPTTEPGVPGATPTAESAAQSAGPASVISGNLVPAGDGGRDAFAAVTVFDALSRPVQVVKPHSAVMKPDVIRPGYDEAGLLSQVDAWLQQTAAPTALLDPATADRHAVTGVTYNARGQRLSIGYGNGTSSAYAYDPQTFRLTRLTTTRPASYAGAQRTVQDLSYYYDPAGNITFIRDDADTQNMIFFRNQRVEPSASYTYDPLYRLISATGREHLGQTGGGLSPPVQVSNDDSIRTSLPQPGDGNAMGTYTETYSYDAIGNIAAMTHQTGPGSWTRRYSYAEPSQITVAETGNRLTATSLPGDPATGPFTGTYAYDAHGSMTRMPHLASLTWNEDDRLLSTSRAAASGGSTPQTTYYAYDSVGQRVRKATDRQEGQPASLKTERIYLDAVEVYREYGKTVTLERETLHLADGERTIALVETRTTGTDKAPAQFVRYQHGNHLGSAVLELDDQSNTITYEEYFPYGSTSYEAVASQTNLPKRYRYTGKERDAENNFNYHGARYYTPWLGRWASCDPIGGRGGGNLYVYCSNSPTNRIDKSGLDDEWSLNPFDALSDDYETAVGEYTAKVAIGFGRAAYKTGEDTFTRVADLTTQAAAAYEKTISFGYIELPYTEWSPESKRYDPDLSYAENEGKTVSETVQGVKNLAANLAKGDPDTVGTVGFMVATSVGGEPPELPNIPFPVPRLAQSAAVGGTAATQLVWDAIGISTRPLAQFGGPMLATALTNQSGGGGQGRGGGGGGKGGGTSSGHPDTGLNKRLIPPHELITRKITVPAIGRGITRALRREIQAIAKRWGELRPVDTAHIRAHVFTQPGETVLVRPQFFSINRAEGWSISQAAAARRALDVPWLPVRPK